MASEGSLLPRLLCVALTSAGCSPPKTSESAPVSRAETAPDPSRAKPMFAIVRITRTLVYDAHPRAGGKLPDIDPESRRVVLDYGQRTVDTRPVVRSYTTRIAVPNDRIRSWDIALGDDYRLLVATRGFAGDAKSVRLDGRVKSNYQVQLDESKGPVGPNSFGFAAQAVGERSAVQVLNDDAAGAIFREFDETEIESLTEAPPDLPAAGRDESEDSQQRRWNEWTPIRKRGLR
jgi:hypothetical protein